ncbi:MULTISPECIES: hemolysin family protein [Corynebacterium]|jgi:CBS domain containing-hemolysin-like protein|uniref:Magnesium and cobalt efflux protein CorC n=1 Tax=Corynebacterium provencense TaxID=1737425 RepID=A0A2Z3YP29_9CORY|nr:MULTISPECIES: hemolysin family protein [Corynebacterium]AWT26268.1 Magnesium and cobalt efflux protein CorC [Corynebacterium provencense]MCI1256971.1 hemolysin family protein [Corynebacterium provencense]
MDILLSILGLLGFILLTAGTGVFVAVEFSTTSLERSTIDNDVATRGDAASRMVQKAHSNLSFMLSGMQLGITLTTLATGYLAEPILAKFFTPALELVGLSESASQPLALVLSLVIATVLSMVFGELVPKNLAIANPLGTARVLTAPVWHFNRIFRGFIRALNWVANHIVRRFGIEPADELASARSPQELSALVRHSSGSEGFDQSKVRILDRSLRFGDATAEDIMTPRAKVDTLDTDDTAMQLIRVAHDSGHSRFPVVRGDLDETVGVVHVKDALTIPAGQRSTTTVGSLARPVPTVPESLGGDAVLRQVRLAGSQLILVADEYGGTAGIVTIEDVVEEILGEVWDEHDNREEEREVRQVGRSWELSGLLRCDELGDICGYIAPDGPYETLGGLIMATLGRIPAVGDRVLLPVDDRGALDSFAEGPEVRWEAQVESMDIRRVDKVMLRPVAATKKEDDSER